jgi:hypothetical protein
MLEDPDRAEEIDLRHLALHIATELPRDPAKAHRVIRLVQEIQDTFLTLENERLARAVLDLASETANLRIVR